MVTFERLAMNRWQSRGWHWPGIGFLLLMLASCFANPATAEPLPKVVSLNLCADQLAVQIAAPGQLLSVSQLAHDPQMAALYKQAKSYPANNGSAEDVFVQKPDLVLAGTATTPATIAMLKKLGFVVKLLAPEQSLIDIRRNIENVGRWLQRENAAAKLLKRFDSELAQLQQPVNGANPEAVIYESNGVSVGAGDMADNVLRLAGFDNLATRLGIAAMDYLPLELLVINKPDLVIRTNDWQQAPALAQQVLEHPALNKNNMELLTVSGRNWICGGLFTLQAVRDLRQIRQRIVNKKAAG